MTDPVVNDDDRVCHIRISPLSLLKRRQEDVIVEQRPVIVDPHRAPRAARRARRRPPLPLAYGDGLEK